LLTIDFDRLEAIKFERHNVAARRLLNVALRRRVKAMGQSLGKVNRLEFQLEGMLKLAKSLRELQRVVFFSP
jgi:hypothetical protein